MDKLKAAELAKNLMDFCADNKIPATLQMDLTTGKSTAPELFLAGCGGMEDYIAMTAEHMVAQAEDQAALLDKPIDALLGAMLNTLEICVEVARGSESISEDIDEIKSHLTVIDKDKLN